MDGQLILFIVFLVIMFYAGKWTGYLRLMTDLEATADDSKPFKLVKGHYKLVKVSDEV
tara:strand:+ start:1964 stop:2137 length:174 start_codon:yes stop_codon:yes gene_type:complete